MLSRVVGNGIITGAYPADDERIIIGGHRVIPESSNSHVIQNVAPARWVVLLEAQRCVVVAPPINGGAGNTPHRTIPSQALSLFVIPREDY